MLDVRDVTPVLSVEERQEAPVVYWSSEILATDKARGWWPGKGDPPPLKSIAAPRCLRHPCCPFLDRGAAFPSVAFSSIEKLPSWAWSLRSGVSSMDDCRNVGHRQGPLLIANAGAPGGRWLHQGEWRGAPDRHSARRTGYQAGVARGSAGSSGIRCREDRLWSLAIGALNGI